jgi:hypothetical protein
MTSGFVIPKLILFSAVEVVPQPTRMHAAVIIAMYRIIMFPFRFGNAADPTKRHYA